MRASTRCCANCRRSAAADPPDRPRLRAAVRLAQRFRDGAVGAAEARQILLIAQDHHRVVLDAIENREGARAEAIMREHARLAARNLRLALSNRDPPRSDAGAGADPFAARTSES